MWCFPVSSNFHYLGFPEMITILFLESYITPIIKKTVVVRQPMTTLLHIMISFMTADGKWLKLNNSTLEWSYNKQTFLPLSSQAISLNVSVSDFRCQFCIILSIYWSMLRTSTITTRITAAVFWSDSLCCTHYLPFSFIWLKLKIDCSAIEDSNWWLIGFSQVLVGTFCSQVSGIFKVTDTLKNRLHATYFHSMPSKFPM